MAIAQYRQHFDASKKGFAALEKVLEFCCSHCGLCACLCPKSSITIIDTIPTLTGDCDNCGLCYQGCPRSFYPLSKISVQWFGPERAETEKRLGRCRERFTARALTDEIFEAGANGGTTTALLHYLLAEKIVDAVLHVGSVHENQFICNHPKTIISTQPCDVIKGARTKYQLTPILSRLADIAAHRRFAVTGLSCHVEALRKLQIMCADDELRTLFPALAERADMLTRNLTFVIGINCFGNIKYGGMDKIYEAFSVDEKDLIKCCEVVKKSLYQLLNEDKNYFWFALEGLVTKDGSCFDYRWCDFVEETVSMGCMLCPSLIVCKQADISIGITASEHNLHEFGYNSVFVRNPELDTIIADMVRERKLLKRPLLENKGRYLRMLLERMFPRRDVINIHGYVATRKWHPEKNIYQPTSPGYTGRIIGLQRLFLWQTLKKNFFFSHSVEALHKVQKFTTDVI